MINFKSEKDEILEDDGSLRDIYFFDTDIRDWNKFINYVRNANIDFNFYKDGNVYVFNSGTADEIFELRNEFSVVLEIKINDASINCHFFDVEEIELDISPREITNDETYEGLLHFIEELSKHIGKPAILTPENTKDYILAEFN